MNLPTSPHWLGCRHEHWVQAVICMTQTGFPPTSVPEDENGDESQNVGFLDFQLSDMTCSLGELYCTVLFLHFIPKESHMLYYNR
jgi:hypothetical protein